MALLSMAGCTDDEEASRPDAPSTSSTPVLALSVGRISATIAPEAAGLGDGADIDLTAEVRGSLERVDELLQFDEAVAVRIEVEAGRAIPEVGVGGSTDPASGAVLVSLDPGSSIGGGRTITDWLPAMLAHELNHSKRILEGPGYGTTLAGAMVAEGLADAFSLRAFPSTPPLPWANALRPEELDRLATLARSKATTPDTLDVHGEWFFGTAELPRWAGYSIGATWVDGFLATQEDVDVVAATLLPAEEIIPE